MGTFGIQGTNRWSLSVSFSSKNPSARWNICLHMVIRVNFAPKSSEAVTFVRTLSFGILLILLFIMVSLLSLWTGHERRREKRKCQLSMLSMPKTVSLTCDETIGFTCMRKISMIIILQGYMNYSIRRYQGIETNNSISSMEL